MARAGRGAGVGRFPHAVLAGPIGKDLFEDGAVENVESIYSSLLRLYYPLGSGCGVPSGGLDYQARWDGARLVVMGYI